MFSEICETTNDEYPKKDGSLVCDYFPRHAFHEQCLQALQEQYYEREETARDKYDDFDQVAYNPNLPVTA